MFRPSIARKVIRLRSTRLITRAYVAPKHHFAPPTNPEDIPRRPLVPLYQQTYEPELPEPEELEAQLEKEETKEWDTKLRLTAMAEAEAPVLDDADLVAFYQALVGSGVEDSADNVPLLEAPKNRMSLNKRAEIIEGLERRLTNAGILAPPQTQTDSTAVATTGDINQRSLQIAAALMQLNVPSSSQVGFSVKGKEKVVRPAALPLGLVSRVEWEALFESFMAAKDARAAEGLLGVMMHHNMSPSEEWVHRVLRLDAFEGRTDDIARLTMGLAEAGNEITTVHHNAFLTSVLSKETPDHRTAISYLREFERRGTPLEQESYDVVLQHLTIPSNKHQTTSHTRALAWDLFAHMRMYAHPTPTKEVYTTMINTCADARDPQPEHARDLWIEMTTEGNKVKPTRDEYNAIIKALGSTKKDYLEAFELLRQMLAQHHDAVLIPFEDQPRKLWSAYVPTL